MEIEKIADIQTGLMLSRKRAGALKESKEYRLLTLRSINKSGILDLNGCEIFLSKDSIEPKFLTKKGDIVQRLTTPFTASCITEEGLLVPSNFAIIRIKNDRFLPEYVSIFLNSENLKKELEKSSISKTIPLVKISHIKKLNVKEMPIDLQNKVIRFSILKNQEELLLQKLYEEKEKLTNSLLNNLLIQA